MWFRSYMEKVGFDSGILSGVRFTFRSLINFVFLQFKDEVVKEVVERMCSDFSGQCCTHKSSDGNLEAGAAAGGVMGPPPGPSTSSGSLGYTPNCSSCHKLTSDGAYKCRWASGASSSCFPASVCFRASPVFWVLPPAACARPASCARCADAATTPATAW